MPQRALRNVGLTGSTCEALLIDIHCHLLPGLDDGPPDDAAALALARACVADGLTHVITTPHVFPGRYDNGCRNIQAAYTRFVTLLAAEGLPLQLSWAGEVRLTPEILDLLPLDELPFMGQVGSARTMLLEMPDGQIPLGAINLVRRLLAAKIRPIIVHPERNRAVMEQPDRLSAFVEAGCFVQLTAGSLVGTFGARAQATAIDLLERRMVHALASDAHNLTGRPPRMSAARQWLTERFGPEVALELTFTGPARLCCENASVNARSPRSPGLDG